MSRSLLTNCDFLVNRTLLNNSLILAPAGPRSLEVLGIERCEARRNAEMPGMEYHHFQKQPGGDDKRLQRPRETVRGWLAWPSRQIRPALHHGATLTMAWHVSKVSRHSTYTWFFVALQRFSPMLRHGTNLAALGTHCSLRRVTPRISTSRAFLPLNLFHSRKRPPQ